MNDQLIFFSVAGTFVSKIKSYFHRAVYISDIYKYFQNGVCSMLWNTPSKFENSTAMETHFRSSAKSETPRIAVNFQVFFSHECLYLRNLCIFKKKKKIRVIQLIKISNTTTNYESSTEIGTYFRRSAKDLNLGPREFP